MATVPPHLLAEVRTLTDWRIPGTLAAFGAAIDRHPGLRPEVLDERDPPRLRVDSFAEHLAALTSEVEPQFRRSYLLRRKKPRVWGTLELHLDFRFSATTGAGAGASTKSGPLSPSRFAPCWEEAAFSAAASLDDLAVLFLEVCEATDALHGWVTTSALAQDTFAVHKKPSIERALPDVGWLNFFGPAFLAVWGGAQRLAGIGVRQVATAGGGLLVVTADSPFLLRAPGAKADAQPFKQPFFEALGPRAFGVGGGGGIGELVPTLDTHASWAPRLEEMGQG